MSAARTAVDRLGTLFLEADVDEVLAEFCPSEEVAYAGSEAGEVAIGRTSLRALLADLFARDERYSWTAGEVHEVESGDALHLVAEAELTVHLRDGEARWRAAERLPYRVSGVLQQEPAAGRWRWRLCCGSEPASSGSE